MKEKPKNYLPLIAEMDGVELKPCSFVPNFSDTRQFKKLDSGSAAKMRISSLVQNLPAMATAGALAGGDIYVATFPKGIPHVLAPFADGSGFMNVVRNPQNGQFMAQARLNPLEDYAVVAGAFAVMSIATSQYYLTAINSKLTHLQCGVDKILEFLYGDKKAELMSEVMFTKYAYENFASIMQHSEQRAATIASLQNSKKIAMKDLEFYVYDLDKLSDNIGKDIPAAAEEALNLKSSLDLTAQLYAMSGITETYYAQNTDAEYLSYAEREMTSYIDWAENHIKIDFAKIYNAVNKNKSIKEEDKQKFDAIMNEFNAKGERPLQKSLKEALHALEQPAIYYIRSDGEVFVEQT